MSLEQKIESELYLPVSIGEALDKLSILDIKLDNIKDSRRDNVKVEYDMLYERLESYVKQCEKYYNMIKISSNIPFILSFIIFFIILGGMIFHQNNELKICNKQLTESEYINHMITHHEVAVHMSKMILKTTNNNFIIDFAYKIIRDQQAEIIKLYSLSKSKYSFESNIL